MFQVEKVKEQIEQENMSQPDGLFDVIAIDPPWEYSEKGGKSVGWERKRKASTSANGVLQYRSVKKSIVTRNTAFKAQIRARL